MNSVEIFGIILLVVLMIVGGTIKKKRQHSKIPTTQSRAITGRDFERYVADALLRRGIAVECRMTKASGDYGADIVIVTCQGVRVCIQCKYYSQNVGVKAVQEVFSAKAIYACSEAWVITNNGFTSSAISLAETLNVTLIPYFR